MNLEPKESIAVRAAKARAARFVIDPPILTGVDYGAGESFTAWHSVSNPTGSSWVREAFMAGDVHHAGSIQLEELAPGVWGRRV